ncbi:2Fe-2S ferredoxin-type domain-containing protein [Pelagophyceae sp. CCMP2097]|nr:2Fe-2S ferredoxin-type domain-containing protein [Pelagophyceae sp. CCMP2097]
MPQWTAALRRCAFAGRGLARPGISAARPGVSGGRPRFLSAAAEPAATVDLTFIDPDGKEHVVPAKLGDTVLAAALAHKIEIEAACGGEMACSTCHVVLEPAQYARLSKPEEEESDMLDLAWGLTDTSRLCCQIKVDPELAGARFAIPEEP